jgi:hypothetical protein
MRITIRHYFDFGDDGSVVGDDLVNPKAWDALRTRTHGAFALPDSREEWERMADARDDIRLRAAEIARWLSDHGISSIASYGAGVGTLELWLHRLYPDLRQTLTDYAPNAVERLAQLFPQAEVIRHDLLTEGPLNANLHLFHRIDTEFTNQQWQSILDRFRGHALLVVATEVINLRRALLELRRRRTYAHASRAGVIRNRAAFEALWRRTHRMRRLRFNDLEAWALEPRSSASGS